MSARYCADEIKTRVNANIGIKGAEDEWRSVAIAVPADDVVEFELEHLVEPTRVEMVEIVQSDWHATPEGAVSKGISEDVGYVRVLRR